MIWIILTTTAIAIIFSMLIAPYRYWKNKGVKQGNFVPLLGDSWGTVLGMHSFADMMYHIYNKVADVRYSGAIMFLKPVLLVKDPLLLKQMFVKDFDHFLSHNSLVPNNSDPILTRSLAFLTGKEWKLMRCILSPNFAGNKLKTLFPLVAKTSKDFTQFFIKQEKKDVIEIEMKEVFSRYANDVIANSVFGIECNSLIDRDNEFFVMGKAATDFSSVWKFIAYIIIFFIPTISRIFKLQIFDEKIPNFYRNIVNKTIKYREKNNISRPDVIQLFMQARNEDIMQTDLASPEIDSSTNNEDEDTNKQGKRILTIDEITAHALAFVTAGFESVSTLLGFMAHELAMNPDVQEKLREEIDRALSENDDLSFDALSGLPYLDMVVSETLRKWPPTPVTDRVCTKSYVIEPKNSGEKRVYIEKGQELLVPIIALHRDPRYFQNPTKFDPERFSAERKSTIIPCTFLPFGIGARNCIAPRYVIMETKALFCYFLSKFQIVPIGKTDTKMILSKKGMFTIHPKNGFWLGLKRRNE